ncbi:Fe2OG dioxygenase domain-containing protein [Forsythia ovata]|uniref:Fe2OG dioxygenase domain-containing protein n=1 Tax=Forsythia ovata TaxID=205694 RepID=A0ABD1S4H8_9LAMI
MDNKPAAGSIPIDAFSVECTQCVNPAEVQHPNTSVKRICVEKGHEDIFHSTSNMATYLSNGRFKNADHQAVVNSNYSRLSIATFQNPAPGAIVYPLKVRVGEYKRKMSKDLELARLKKLAKEKPLNEETNVKPESIEEIIA